MAQVLDVPALARSWETRLIRDGFPVGPVSKIRLSTRMTRSLGTTRRCVSGPEGPVYVLSFSMALCEMPAAYVDVTIVHEFIHTFPECMNHGRLFREWGRQLQERYSLCCPISRISTQEMTEAFRSTAFITGKKQKQKKKRKKRRCRLRHFLFLGRLF